MANDVQIFDSEEFGQIRTTMIDDMPYFVGKDVAAVLGYKDTATAIRQHVDTEDKLTRCFVVSGQRRDMYIINESGLYSLILSSKLPTAREFKHWVTSSVLPMIRRTGIYATQAAIADGDSIVPMRTLTPDDYLAAARLIATCKADRLKIILGMLAKAGWEIDNAQHILTSGISTADIGPRIQQVLTEQKLSWAELSDKTGIPAETLRSYRDGRRFPKPDRYTALVEILDTLTSNT